jgi:hypothetical protein
MQSDHDVTTVEPRKAPGPPEILSAFRKAMRFWWQRPEPPTDSQLRMAARIFASGWMESAQARNDKEALEEGIKITAPMSLKEWQPGPEWKWWQA